MNDQVTRVISDAELPDSMAGDRKSTRLNSSHSQISYAVFCLKKKKQVMRGRGRVANVPRQSRPICACWSAARFSAETKSGTSASTDPPRGIHVGAATAACRV